MNDRNDISPEEPEAYASRSGSRRMLVSSLAEVPFTDGFPGRLDSGRLAGCECGIVVPKIAPLAVRAARYNLELLYFYCFLVSGDASNAYSDPSDVVLGGRAPAASPARPATGCVGGSRSGLDGLSILAGVDAYGRWHHVLTHGLLAGVLISLLFSRWAEDRMKVWWLALVVFHLHPCAISWAAGSIGRFNTSGPGAPPSTTRPMAGNWIPGRIGSRPLR